MSVPLKYKSVKHNFLTVICPAIQFVNGQVNATSVSENGHYLNGTIITFTCNSGYILDTTGSSSSIICLATGYWSNSTPRCNIGNENIYSLRFKFKTEQKTSDSPESTQIYYIIL